jgi:dCMP deaminase
MSRISWDQYFLAMAKIAAMRSGCNSRPTGAVIVRDNRVIATGCNGSLPGRPQCTDSGPTFCFRRSIDVPEIDKYNYCRAVHAEQNALNQAAKLGVSVDGADMFCTLAPCYICLKSMASCGIKNVYYEHEYESQKTDRDRFWSEELGNVLTVQRVELSDETVCKICADMGDITSKRKLV